MIYLDNAATTPMSTNVLAAMIPYLTDRFGNPGSVYWLGIEAQYAVDKARKQVATRFGAQPEQILFTSGGSEGNNMVIRGLEKHLRQINRTKILTTAVEHESVLSAMRSLQDKGFEVVYLPVGTDGSVTEETLTEFIDESVGLLSMMYVNNETGAVNPVQFAGKLCDRFDVLFHTDCVQAAAAKPLDVPFLRCDYATISGHKLYGPKGVGALFVRDTDAMERLDPIISGGAMQEYGKRGGTENVSGIVGLGAACEALAFPTAAYDKWFMSALSSHFPGEFDRVFHRNGAENCVHNILNLRINGVDAETLVLMLSGRNIFISAGSACNSHSSEPSHVLTAMGLTPEQARSSVRISFNSNVLFDDVVLAADGFATDVKTLKGVG